MSKRILVVEDDAAALQALVALLRINGHEVWGFANAEKTQTEGPVEVDTALIDVQLPGLLGTELAKELKKNQHDMKVILMTGHRVDVDSLVPGTTLFVKPLNCERLLKAL